MPLNAEEKLNLFSSYARPYWIEAESNSHAYQRMSLRSGRVNNWLKIGTLVVAVVTAATALFPASLGLLWLIKFPAALTALLAIVDKISSPSETSKKCLDCRTKMASVKRDLIKLSLLIEDVLDMTTGIEAFTQIAGRIDNIVQEMAVTATDADREKCEKDFVGTMIASTIASLKISTGRVRDREPDLKVDDDTLPESAEDAPDVLPIYRSKTTQLQRLIVQP